MKRNLEPRDLFGNAVGSTLAIPLYARARGAERFDIDDWDDPQARQVWDALEKIAADKGQRLEDLVPTDISYVVGTIRRSQDIDARVRDFADAQGHIQVVTVGVGMCNRRSRLADLDADWIGLDNAAVIELRRGLLPDDPVRLISGSATERGWLDEIDPGAPTILVAEGLLMYFDRAHVTQLISRVGDHFTGPTQLVADVHHSFIAALPTPITRRTGATFEFGAMSPSWFAGLVPGWTLVGADDSMSRISANAARASRFFQLVNRSMPYGVMTIERDRS